jgi:hypothetical protein
VNPPVLQRDDPAEKGTNYLDTIDGWSSFCRTLPRGMRRVAFFSIFVRPNIPGMIVQLLRMIVWSKIEGGSEPGYRIARIGLNVDFSVRAALLVCRLACLLPAGVFVLARETYRKVKYGWMARPLPPNYHVPVEQDDLRR